MDDDQKNLLLILRDEMSKNKFDTSDNISNICANIENIGNNPTQEKLDNLKENIDYLMDKYDDLYELEYYFAPLHSKIKRKLHEEYVKELRRKNREKRRKMSTYE